jgi:hypothetical protein
MSKSWYRAAEILMPNELNAAIAKAKKKSTTVNVTVPKKKYASIGTSQMRSGRRSTIQTSSSGLLSSASIGKKTLLGG